MVFKCQEDSFLKEFTSKVTSCIKAEIDITVEGKKTTIKGYEVICENTILFPEGGGQPSDHGFLNDIKVHQVLRRGADAVHLVEEPINVGDEVIQKIDWERRLDHMQQHSGQHLITAIIDREFKYSTVSWWLGEDVSHIELDTTSMSTEEINKAEKIVNELIRDGRKVTVDVIKYGEETNLNEIRARGLPKDHVGDVRTITIEGVESNMCCGTHVSNLCQLQVIKLLHTEKSPRKKNILLYFLVGNRVLNRLSSSIARDQKMTAILNESDNDEECTPSEIVETVITSVNLLPEKSKKIYGQTYMAFMEWRSANKINSFSENVLLAYFTKLSEKYKSTSLWKIYSLLRSTLIINNEINIANYSKLRAFLKRKAEGHQAKKSKTFTPEEINKFITEAPDDVYLATKVALIMGTVGACRSNEMYSMQVKDIEDLQSAFLVIIPSKTKIVRRFIITGKFYDICKKYANLRPPNAATSSFFLNYQRGKCTVQKIGINKFTLMGKQIASYLKLPNANLYTGHSFRRSSATFLIDADGDISDLKRQRSWESTSVTESYVNDSIKSEINTTETILQPVEQNPKTFHIIQQTSNTLNEVKFDKDSTPSVVNFTNCSNFNITFVKK